MDELQPGDIDSRHETLIERDELIGLQAEAESARAHADRLEAELERVRARLVRKDARIERLAARIAELEAAPSGRGAGRRLTRLIGREDRDT